MEKVQEKLTGKDFVTIPAGIGAGTYIGAWIGPEGTKYLVPRYLEFDGKELEALDCKEYVTEI